MGTDGLSCRDLRNGADPEDRNIAYLIMCNGAAAIKHSSKEKAHHSRYIVTIPLSGRFCLERGIGVMQITLAFAR